MLGEKPKDRIWIERKQPDPFLGAYTHQGDSLINMIFIDNHWVWVGEYYSDPYKIKGGIIDVKA